MGNCCYFLFSVIWITTFSTISAFLMDGVNIFSISACDDIAEVGTATITVSGQYPSGFSLTQPRSCRFVIQSQNLMDSVLGGIQLVSVLEFPFRLGPDDYILFMDSGLRLKYPEPCMPIQSDSSAVLKITANTTQYGSLGHDFSVNDTTMLIDFCSSGSRVPVNFMVSLTRAAPTGAGEHGSQALAWPDGGNLLSPFSLNMPAGIPTGSATQECGRTWNPPDRNRIVNGQVARDGYFPWTVALLHTRFKQYCGGSILNSLWIITAAHCVIGPLELRDIIANTTVVVGLMNLEKNSPQYNYQIDQVAVHPQYDPKGWLNDIALIKLKQPITSLNSANGARQICLPKRSLNDLNREFSATNRSVTCFLAGWGYTSEGAGINVLSQNLGSGSSLAEAASGTAGASQIGAGSNQLLYGKLNFIPLDTCQQNYRVGGISLQGAPQFVRDNMVCASNEQKGQGACLGDSGGGLYCKEVDGTWGIYGISSWSGGCARKDLPSVFSNVFLLRSNFVDRVLARRPPPSRVPGSG